ncbi:MAG: SDR family oxidoreductase [Mucilaginibacter polytrichastri]|nr:SDR family oxidoreductase [Mucilaginibacter polytrichastri]
MNDFTNEVAIVTGAGQGIGFEICRQLVGAGASVILNDIDANLAETAAAKIRGEKGSCIAVPGDSSAQSCIDEMIGTALHEFGKLDIVVANAGITLFGDFLNYKRESFEKVMQTNLSGSFFLAQAAAKQMITQKSGGSLLFMSSVTGHQAHKDLAAYGMTKAALEMLARNLVIELSQHGITVNTVAPGATLTERTMEDAGYQQIWSEITPMGRAGKPDDVAQAVLFLVSKNARHITGQNLVVDGGWSRISPSPF